ncbi:MAG: MBOAT family O-acyltransferase [Chitinophagales bacterium]
MIFNSFEFLVFFVVVTTVFFLLPHRFRWFHLLAASIFFYSYFIPIYILVLFLTIIIDYFAGLQIERNQGKSRKYYLVLSLIANIGILAIFKYYNFFATNINALFDIEQSHFQLILLSFALPIGLSFHTFQAMSYTIEVYRGNQKAERHFGIYALYVMFYPQLVAGPIERPQNVLHQFYEKQSFSYQNAVRGLRLMLWGMFKKVVIADNLSVVVDHVYNNPDSVSGLSVFTAAVFFSFQIYCDFSGYSDIALGCARFMGFNLMKNFNIPYYAKSISEFWSRWHISLSTWFRDYLYIPLGGNKGGELKAQRNVFIVFMVSGLWHGANWTFVFWGFLHGLYTVVGRFSKSFRSAAVNKVVTPGSVAASGVNLLEVFFNFLLVTFTWVFFRANSMTHAFDILQNCFKTYFLPQGNSVTAFVLNWMKELNMGVSDVLVLGSAIFILEAGHWVLNCHSGQSWMEERPVWVRYFIYCAITTLILVFGNFGVKQFIYFQF